jgi:hypothetical protein
MEASPLKVRLLVSAHGGQHKKLLVIPREADLKTLLAQAKSKLKMKKYPRFAFLPISAEKLTDTLSVLDGTAVVLALDEEAFQQHEAHDQAQEKDQSEMSTSNEFKLPTSAIEPTTSCSAMDERAHKKEHRRLKHLRKLQRGQERQGVKAAEEQATPPKLSNEQLNRKFELEFAKRANALYGEGGRLFAKPAVREELKRLQEAGDGSSYDWTCAICFDLLCEPVCPPCRLHSFCHNCLLTMLLEDAQRHITSQSYDQSHARVASSCPMCKTTINSASELAATPRSRELQQEIETRFPAASAEGVRRSRRRRALLLRNMERANATIKDMSEGREGGGWGGEEDEEEEEEGWVEELEPLGGNAYDTLGDPRLYQWRQQQGMAIGVAVAGLLAMMWVSWHNWWY